MTVFYQSGLSSSLLLLVKRTAELIGWSSLLLVKSTVDLIGLLVSAQLSFYWSLVKRTVRLNSLDGLSSTLLLIGLTFC